MDHIHGPVQGAGSQLPCPGFIPTAVVFHEEKVIAAIMCLTVQGCSCISTDTNIPIGIDTHSACIIRSGGAQLLGPGFVSAAVILDEDQIQFPGIGVAVKRASGVASDVGVS